MSVKTTIDTGWTPVSVGDGFYITTTLGVTTTWTDIDASPVSPAIPASTKLSGSKILVFIEITAASGTDTTTDVFMEMSADGVNWTTNEAAGQDYIELSTALTHNVPGWYVYVADLQEFRVPYYRIGFNSQGTNMAGALRFKMGYSYAK